MAPEPARLHGNRRPLAPVNEIQTHDIEWPHAPRPTAPGRRTSGTGWPGHLLDIRADGVPARLEPERVVAVREAVAVGAEARVSG